MKALLIFLALFFGVQIVVYSMSSEVMTYVGLGVFLLAVIGLWKWASK